MAKGLGAPIYCSNWKNNQQSPRVGHGEVCMPPSTPFFISFSENSLICPGHCYACCLISTCDETRPQRPQWICYFSSLKLSYCSFQDWAGPSNTGGGNSSRSAYKTFFITTLNKLNWLTTKLLSRRNKEKQIKIIRKKKATLKKYTQSFRPALTIQSFFLGIALVFHMEAASTWETTKLLILQCLVSHTAFALLERTSGNCY